MVRLPGRLKGVTCFNCLTGTELFAPLPPLAQHLSDLVRKKPWDPTSFLGILSRVEKREKLLLNLFGLELNSPRRYFL